MIGNFNIKYNIMLSLPWLHSISSLINCYASPWYQPVGLVLVRTLGTDHSVHESDRSDLVIGVTEGDCGERQDYMIYN